MDKYLNFDLQNNVYLLYNIYGFFYFFILYFYNNCLG